MNTEWLEEMYAHVAASRLDEAMDLLFDRVDDALCDGLMTEVDALLPMIDLTRLDTNLMVGLLSVTSGAKVELTNRAALVTDISARIMEIVPERAERILRGLR